MATSNCLVAFIDILGFKNLVDDYFSGKDKTSLKVINNALKEANEFGISYAKNHLKKYDISFKFKQFSDCVSISMPIVQQNHHSFLTIIAAFINVIRVYNIILLENGIIVRGAISIGNHFENTRTIFSQGLISSYILESQKAIYPRVIIDKKVIEIINQTIKEYSEEYGNFYSFCGNSFIKDWDDEIFVSPFKIFEGFNNSNENIDPMFSQVIDFLKRRYKIKITLSDLKAFLLNPDNEKDLLFKLLKKEKEIISQLTTEKGEIILKHKWLSEFLKWNVSPNESRIKFEHYFIPI